MSYYFTRYSTLLQLDELNEVHCSVIGHASKRTENAHLFATHFFTGGVLVQWRAGTEEASGVLFSFVVSICPMLHAETVLRGVYVVV